MNKGHQLGNCVLAAAKKIPAFLAPKLKVAGLQQGSPPRYKSCES
jgi:hypothetical protein